MKRWHCQVCSVIKESEPIDLDSLSDEEQLIAMQKIVDANRPRSAQFFSPVHRPDQWKIHHQQHELLERQRYEAAKKAIQKKEDADIFACLMKAADEREPLPGHICGACASHDVDTEARKCNDCNSQVVVKTPVTRTIVNMTYQIPSSKNISNR